MSSSGATRCHAHCCQPQYRRAPRPEAKAPRSPAWRTSPPHWRTPTPKRISTPWGRRRERIQAAEALPISSVGASRAAARWAWPSFAFIRNKSISSPVSLSTSAWINASDAPAPSMCIALSRNGQFSPHMSASSATDAAGAPPSASAPAPLTCGSAAHADGELLGSSSSTTPKLYDTGVLGRSGPKRARTKGTTRVSPADTARNASWWPSSQILMFWNESPDGGSACAAGAHSAGHASNSSAERSHTPLPQAGSLGAHVRLKPPPAAARDDAQNQTSTLGAVVATTGVAPHSYEPMSGERCVAPSKTRTKPCSLSDVAQPSANDVKLSVSPTADDDAWIRNEHSVVRTASSGTTEIAPSGASKMASPEQVAAVGEIEQARTRTESAARCRPRVRRRREPSVFMLHGGRRTGSVHDFAERGREGGLGWGHE